MKAKPKKAARKIKDKVPELKVDIPSTQSPVIIPAVRDPTLIYSATRSLGRGSFQLSEYDLVELGKIEDTESFVRQAMNKKTALMFKEGWDIVGPNLKTITYIKTRLAQIEQASNVSSKLLFRSIGSSLIRKSNAFLIKVRKASASGGKSRTIPGTTTTLEPVAAYFVVPAETMEYQLSGNKIVKWRQKMPDGNFKEWNPRDVIHFYCDRKDGFIFGTPLLVPVIDDIRALRKIEENIELLVYQHLFPLFQYKVGTPEAPAGYTEDGRKEIDVVKLEIQYMPTEGGIVTPDRHEIKAIGAEGRALRAEEYLEYFKKRVIAGLGISSVDLGEGATVNRSTSDNLSRNLIDSVKDYQQIFEAFFNTQIITELLLESTFGDEVLNRENLCQLRFKEIDIDIQIRKEAHYADQFAKNVISWDEARRFGFGLEPIQTPTREEIQSEQDTAELYPEWHKTFWKLFEEPKLLIAAADEAWTPAAKAAAKSTSLELSQGDLDEAGEEQIEHETELEKEKGKTAIAVAKAKPKPKPAAKRKDGYLATTYDSIAKDVIAYTQIKGKLEHDWIGQLIRTQMETTITELITDQMRAFRNGYVSNGGKTDIDYISKAAAARLRFNDRANLFIQKLTNDLIALLKRRVDNLNGEIIAETRAVFDVLRYRTDFIEDVEISKARNWGKCLAWKENGKLVIGVQDQSGSCEICSSNTKNKYALQMITMEDMPPYHAGCQCKLYLPEQPIQDSFQLDDVKKTKSKLRPQSKHAEFNKCVIKTKARLRSQHMDWSEEELEIQAEAACDHILQDERKEVEDGVKLERCVKKVKIQMKTEHPDWDDEKIKSSAFAICNASLKDK